MPNRTTFLLFVYSILIFLRTLKTAKADDNNDESDIDDAGFQPPLLNSESSIEMSMTDLPLEYNTSRNDPRLMNTFSTDSKCVVYCFIDCFKSPPPHSALSSSSPFVPPENPSSTSRRNSSSSLNQNTPPINERTLTVCGCDTPSRNLSSLQSCPYFHSNSSLPLEGYARDDHFPTVEAINLELHQLIFYSLEWNNSFAYILEKQSTDLVSSATSEKAVNEWTFAGVFSTATIKYAIPYLCEMSRFRISVLGRSPAGQIFVTVLPTQDRPPKPDFAQYGDGWLIENRVYWTEEQNSTGPKERGHIIAEYNLTHPPEYKRKDISTYTARILPTSCRAFDRIPKFYSLVSRRAGAIVGKCFKQKFDTFLGSFNFGYWNLTNLTEDGGTLELSLPGNALDQDGHCSFIIEINGFTVCNDSLADPYQQSVTLNCDNIQHYRCPQRSDPYCLKNVRITSIPALKPNTSNVILSWTTPIHGSPREYYHIRYGTIDHENSLDMKEVKDINQKDPETLQTSLIGLQPNELYRVFVCGIYSRDDKQPNFSPVANPYTLIKCSESEDRTNCHVTDFELDNDFVQNFGTSLDDADLEAEDMADVTFSWTVSQSVDSYKVWLKSEESCKQLKKCCDIEEKMIAQTVRTASVVFVIPSNIIQYCQLDTMIESRIPGDGKNRSKKKLSRISIDWNDAGGENIDADVIDLEMANENMAEQEEEDDDESEEASTGCPINSIQSEGQNGTKTCVQIHSEDAEVTYGPLSFPASTICRSRYRVEKRKNGTFVTWEGFDENNDLNLLEIRIGRVTLVKELPILYKFLDETYLKEIKSSDLTIAEAKIPAEFLGSYKRDRWVIGVKVCAYPNNETAAEDASETFQNAYGMPILIPPKNPNSGQWLGGTGEGSDEETLRLAMQIVLPISIITILGSILAVIIYCRWKEINEFWLKRRRSSIKFDVDHSKTNRAMRLSQLSHSDSLTDSIGGSTAGSPRRNSGQLSPSFPELSGGSSTNNNNRFGVGPNRRAGPNPYVEHPPKLPLPPPPKSPRSPAAFLSPPRSPRSPNPSGSGPQSGSLSNASPYNSPYRGGVNPTANSQTFVRKQPSVGAQQNLPPKSPNTLQPPPTALGLPKIELNDLPPLTPTSPTYYADHLTIPGGNSIS